jgi:phospholipid N-methyltransferase
MPQAISDQVLDVLRRSEIGKTHLTLPEQLERNDYVAVDKVLKKLGVKWDKKAKAHLFNTDARATIAAALEEGKFVDHEQELGFFPTPFLLAAKMSEFALTSGDTVLEPSAGDGGIAVTFNARAIKTAHLIEIDPGRCEILRKKFRYKVYEHDFLEVPIEAKFDAVVMNPPFGKDVYVDHIMHAWNFLKIGGKMAALTPKGWQFKEFKKIKAFREFVEENDFDIDEQPEKQFSKTDIGVVLLTAVKKR